jgi:glucan 1,3-beta-glucosidase
MSNEFRLSAPAFSARWLWVALALVHLVLLAGLLVWCHAETRPVPMHALQLEAGEKLRCVSYAPFHRPGQTPFDAALTISRQQIAEDLRALSAITGCVRVYSINSGLDQVPAVARELGIKVLLGAWVGYNREKNAAELDRAIALANEYHDVVRALIVGNEVLLRQERSVDEMRALIRDARQRSAVPVTYADVWEFWLKNEALAGEVDFVTVHILPFWEDTPVDIGRALAHVAQVRTRVGAHFPGKAVLIGETGWPSAGRQRGESLPSRVNQARYIREFVHQAQVRGWDYNLIEAIDQPWKRRLEGTVGGFWGMLNADSVQPKFPLTGAVAERDSLTAPLAGAGVGAVFVLMLALVGRRCLPVRPRGWCVWHLLAVTLAGATSGLIAVLHAEHALLAYESVAHWIALGAMALAAVLACVALARWQGERLAPADTAWLRLRHEQRSASAADVLSVLRGVILFGAAVAALLLWVDPRYRDFPGLLYLTPAAIYGLIGWRSECFCRAERICAAMIAAGVVGRWLPEPGNPQAIGWLLTGLVLAAPTLVQEIRHWRAPGLIPQECKQAQQRPDGGGVGAIQHESGDSGEPANPAQ